MSVDIILILRYRVQWRIAKGGGHGCMPICRSWKLAFVSGVRGLLPLDLAGGLPSNSAAY